MTDQPQHQGMPHAHPTTNNNDAAQNPQGQFSLHSSPVMKQIRALKDYLHTTLVASDKKDGMVYVAKQVDTDFCKVGFTENEAEKRVDAIQRCEVNTEDSYSTPPAKCAWRAEHIVHKLLYLSCHHRLHCACKHENREWFQHDYKKVILQVQIIHSWLEREPYHMDTGTLKETWSKGLDQWWETQESQKPLEWNDFFLAGPTMPTIACSYYATPFPPMPVRQFSFTEGSMKKLAKMIVREQHLVLKQIRESVVFSGCADISESPVSTSFEAELSIQKEQQAGPGFPESQREKVDDPEAKPDEHPYFAPSTYAEIDVVAITADMPGAYPTDTAQEASPVSIDEFGRPESLSCNEVVSVQFNVSHSYIRHSAHSASETVSITHHFSQQQAASCLGRPLISSPIPLATLVTEAAEIPPADLSSEEQTTDTQVTPFGASPMLPETIPESSIMPATEVMHKDTGFRKNLSADTTPSPQIEEQVPPAVDQELFTGLPPLNEEKDENARPDTRASDLAPAKARSADLIDGTSQGDEWYSDSFDPWVPRRSAAAAQLDARKILQPKSLRQKLSKVSKGNLATSLPVNISQVHDQLPAAAPGPATKSEEERQKTDGVSGLLSTRDMPICIDSPVKDDKKTPRPATKIKVDRHGGYKVKGSLEASSIRIGAGAFEEDDSDTPRGEKKFDPESYNAPRTPVNLIPQKADIFHKSATDVSIYDNVPSSPMHQFPASPVPDAQVAKFPSEEDDDEKGEAAEEDPSSSKEEQLSSADGDTYSEYTPSLAGTEVSVPDTPDRRRQRRVRQSRTIPLSEVSDLSMSARRQWS